ncbi:hypothetical protein GUJ93_ZPchr0001g31125 [Zizania palustris]|uniref:Uncharacterized protein n=1 Tax=Zizania palustris TaxID=103762 RepID=A0A8J5RWT7_ZIZPA|nr:hypothetical protein GUJ93_ZPchr0001g31125 [Zizania palustris]
MYAPVTPAAPARAPPRLLPPAARSRAPRPAAHPAHCRRPAQPGPHCLSRCWPPTAAPPALAAPPPSAPCAPPPPISLGRPLDTDARRRLRCPPASRLF